MKERIVAVNELNVTNSVSHPGSTRQEKQNTRAYVESPTIHPASLDILKQFQANMNTLEDLNGRLRFVMAEIRGVIRK